MTDFRYAYLVGTLVLAIAFVSIFLIRRDLRKTMVYSGLFYVVVLACAFFILLLFLSSTGSPRSITPGYWTPPTLFNLGQKTGGLAIEDLLFMFFNGGVAAALYELVFSQKVSSKSDKRLKKGYAMAAGLLAAYIVFAFTPLNAIYILISFQLFGALALIWQRRDLLVHSLAGGLLFVVFYGVLFLIFNLLFPTFIGNYYHLQNTSHVWFLGIPLEEYLYGLSFGMLWAPLYEYEFRVRDAKIRPKRGKAQRLPKLKQRGSVARAKSSIMSYNYLKVKN